MTARRNTISLPRVTTPISSAPAADLRLFRFDAVDDDDEFYVRAPSRASAFRILDERSRVKNLRLQYRDCIPLDIKK